MTKRKRHYSIHGSGGGKFDHTVTGKKKNARLRPISDMNNWPPPGRSNFNATLFIICIAAFGAVLIMVFAVIWAVLQIWQWINS